MNFFVCFLPRERIFGETTMVYWILGWYLIGLIGIIILYISTKLEFGEPLTPTPKDILLVFLTSISGLFALFVAMMVLITDIKVYLRKSEW